MDPQVGLAAFRVAFLIFGASLVILPLQSPDSAEFVVTLMAAAVGLAFMGVVLALNRLASPPLPPRGPRTGDNPPGTRFNAGNQDGGTYDRS